MRLAAIGLTMALLTACSGTGDKSTEVSGSTTGSVYEAPVLVENGVRRLTHNYGLEFAAEVARDDVTLARIDGTYAVLEDVWTAQMWLDSTEGRLAFDVLFDGEQTWLMPRSPAGYYPGCWTRSPSHTIPQANPALNGEVPAPVEILEDIEGLEVSGDSPEVFIGTVALGPIHRLIPAPIWADVDALSQPSLADPVPAVLSRSDGALYRIKVIGADVADVYEDDAKEAHDLMDGLEFTLTYKSLNDAPKVGRPAERLIAHRNDEGRGCR